jgi:hypothetical protein
MEVEMVRNPAVLMDHPRKEVTEVDNQDNRIFHQIKEDSKGEMGDILVVVLVVMDTMVILVVGLAAMAMVVILGVEKNLL